MDQVTSLLCEMGGKEAGFSPQVACHFLQVRSAQIMLNNRGLNQSSLKLLGRMESFQAAHGC